MDDLRLGQRHRALMWAVLFGVPAVCIAALIDRRSMWMDEATSVYVASRSLAGMAAILRHVDAVFAFYYALLHAWLTFGSGTTYTRLLSALFAIATLPVVFALTQRVASRQAAFLATLTFGTSYTFLRFAVEARPYSLEILLCAISGLYFVMLLETPRRQAFIGYGLSTLLAIYAHPLALLWAAAHAASLAFVPRSRALLRGYCLTLTAVAIGMSPLLAGVRLNGTRQIDWIPPLTPLRALQFLEGLAAGDRGGPLHAGELAIAVTLCTLAGALIARSVQPKPARILSVWLLLPLLAALLVSIWKPIDESRYFCYVVIPAFALIGIALGAFRRSAGTAACTIVLLILACGGVTQMLVYRGEDWRAASAFLDRVAPADGVIVFTNNALRPLQYAQNERGIPLHGVLLYPHIAEWTGDQNRQPVPADLPERAARTSPRLWVVLSHGSRYWQPQVLAPLSRFYDDVAIERFGELIEVHQLRMRQRPAHAGLIHSFRKSGVY